MAPKNAKRGLGKGLDAMIPAKVTNAKKEIPTEQHIEGQVVKLNITKIEPNRNQPRKTFDEDALLELAESIKQFGIINPIIVTDKKDHYEIVGGERRWRAARKAGLKEVPVIIKDLTENEIAEIALIDNIQREDINPIEEALAYKKLIEDFGYTQDVVAEKVSKSRVTITNSLRLLKLGEKVRQMVIDGQLSTGHARALIPVDDLDEQYLLAQKVFDEKLNVRDTEKLVKNLGKTASRKKTATKSNPSIDAVYAEVSEKCKQALGTKVEVTSKGDGVGLIQIEFYNNDDLEKIIDRICRE
ncbi:MULTISPECIES: ParB/RepB/Spo0J family partition protein [unclassified Butyrivibrio]|uniref:ParB/RepB/Spo0J family partition protein n=1 Tax=unclassified Butyrivibrio TaxID=2639466 RepID=UPI0003B2EFF3|nr:MULTISPECIES: ParB/RepB/Spo0J family partition protein [unclassified Butyrivibrio]